jgi:hypothetical protein
LIYLYLLFNRSIYAEKTEDMLTGCFASKNYAQY